MRNVRSMGVALALFCLVGLAVPSMAAEVDCDTSYCFAAEDFGQEEEPLAGICVTGLPESKTGTVMLGSRVLRAGDILTADQVEAMIFYPLDTREDQVAEVSYCPFMKAGWNRRR